MSCKYHLHLLKRKLTLNSWRVVVHNYPNGWMIYRDRNALIGSQGTFKIKTAATGIQERKQQIVSILVNEFLLIVPKLTATNVSI